MTELKEDLGEVGERGILGYVCRPKKKSSVRKTLKIRERRERLIEYNILNEAFGNSYKERQVSLGKK